MGGLWARLKGNKMSTLYFSNLEDALENGLTVASIGGKAFNLARLKQAVSQSTAGTSFKVPRGGVLTTAAFDCHCQGNSHRVQAPSSFFLFGRQSLMRTPPYREALFLFLAEAGIDIHFLRDTSVTPLMIRERILSADIPPCICDEIVW